MQDEIGGWVPRLLDRDNCYLVLDGVIEFDCFPSLRGPERGQLLRLFMVGPVRRPPGAIVKRLILNRDGLGNLSSGVLFLEMVGLGVEYRNNVLLVLFPLSS